ncbi:MAG: aminotransferase class V-fold PLP-dependent enzyme [Bacteroidales bacterium]|nr:aminotransferase class V-fold PLP-dependent enzyme [Bacteroidales bacterium]
MIQFQCDYNEGCAPEILQRLQETNMMQTSGYGMDPICEHARQLIREACQAPNALVQFLVGGTQTNATVIASALRPYQGVLCATTGHINAHETGAVEHTGHKVLALPEKDGRISAEQIREALVSHFADGNAEHVVQPGMVYISMPTEVGTTYSLAELTAISQVCREYQVPLFVDGARLGYGLASPDCDVTLADLARLADVFYIGGTKQGALFGEAVVITNPALQKDFRYNIKQNGGMLAKGRLLGIQFETLFTDNLYMRLSEHAIQMAMRIKDALARKGYRMYIDSPTNQQFPIMDRATYDRLSKSFLFDYWGAEDEEHVVVRICTSWATKEENVNLLISEL